MGDESQGAAGSLGASPLVYYLDTSLQIDLCRAIALVRDDVVYPEDPEWRQLKDEDWLPVIGFKDWVVLMRDTRIRYRPWEQQQLIAHGVRAFCFTHAGNYKKWRTLDLIVRRWDEMEEIARVEGGPYIYSVTYEGIKRLI